MPGGNFWTNARKNYMGYNDPLEKGFIMKRNKPYRFRNFLLDAIMLCLTAGFWIIWIVIRELQAFSK